MLLSVLVIPLEEGRGGFGEVAEEVYQSVVWLEGISDQERLDKIGLYSLKVQRPTGELIEVSKIVRDRV